MIGRRLAVTAALTTALGLCAASPATATFPGRNGEIVFIEGTGWKYANQQLMLLRFAPRLGQPAQHHVCGRTWFDARRRCNSLGAAAPSPDGSTLAAVANEETRATQPSWALWLLNPFGDRTASVALSSEHRVLSWSPDGSELLAARADGVVVLGLDGSERRLVAPGATDGDWCADGRIVVERYGQLSLVRRNGAVRRLTWRGGAEPSCAPGARRVAFTRRGAVWTLPLRSGRRARRLTRGRTPAWSPDGRQIAFLRSREFQDVTDAVLHRIGLRRLKRRQVSRDRLRLEDAFDPVTLTGPDWRPLSRSAASPSG